MVILTHALVPAGSPLATTADPAIVTQAQRWLEWAVARDGGNRLAYQGLAFALAAAGQEEEAVKAWQIADPTLYDFIMLVDTARRIQNRAHAVRWDRWAAIFRELAEQVPPDEPGSSEICHEWGRILLDQKEPPERILDVFTMAIERDRFFEQTHKVEAHFLRAEVLRGMKRWQEALRDYEWVTRFGEAYRGSWMWPVPYWAWVHQGHIYQRIYKNPEKAQRRFEAATKFNPNAKWAYLRLGALLQEQGKIEEARTVFKKVLQLDPCDEIARSVLDVGDALHPLR